MPMIACTGCGNLLWIAEEPANKKVLCPACQAVPVLPPSESATLPPGTADADATLAPVADPDATLAPTPTGHAAPEDTPPDLRDHPRYRIVRLLGKGGMGAVYEAEHLMMDRTVALKVIHRHFTADSRAVERFRREVRAAAKLQHPNIVQAFDAEQAGDTQLLVMEFVEGRSLADHLRDKTRLSIREACSCIRQAALGLQHAHEKRMVHRDIKPDNLMLTASGQLKILDFGLARLGQAETPTTSDPVPDQPTEGNTSRGATQPETTGERTGLVAQLTAAGTVMGTPDYVAPEQVSDSSKVDIRADIYSLGCSLYQCLTGQVPFPDGDITDRLIAHSSQSPVPVRQLRPGVPPALAAVVAKMMEKDPAKRYQNPGEVAAALVPFAEGKKARWLSRLVPVALTVLLVALSLAWGLGAFTAQMQPGETRATANQDETGEWVDLFNGWDLTGWKTHPAQPAGWGVEDGQLVGRSAQIAHLFSERGDYENLHLRAEVKINQFGNSGIYFRNDFNISRGGSPNGYEAQILNDYRLGTRSLTGGIFGFANLQTSAVVTEDWFTMDVIARGNQLTIKVNDAVTTNYVDPRYTYRKGHLALQAWSDQPGKSLTVVNFRKIAVKELR